MFSSRLNHFPYLHVYSAVSLTISPASKYILAALFLFLFQAVLFLFHLIFSVPIA